ncbi:ATP-binding protein [Streptomyces sp. H51]|uniref:ATP-binding protein n=1 Tax=Streptomyces sp. H51 TaxID=3111770 RepID=UPI002D791676|nr:ATP-binding protein [Streptomyces sp. H51]
MSQLRAPAARADRREGGRHGRPVARPVTVSPETRIRPQLLRLAVLPPVAVALGAGAAVLFTVRSTGARPGPALWGVLAGAASLAVAGILVAAVAADRAARSVSDRVGALRRSTNRGEADLRAVVETLRRGGGPPERRPRSGPPEGADDFELLAADLARAHDGAVTAVVQAAQLSSQTGSEQKLEVFLNLARRLQSLVHREISVLDELESEIEDPDLLKGLFHVDHLATRVRRHAENLAVLGGAVSRRQWSHPVPMTEVLRSAIAEVEQYSRVKLVPPIEGELLGHAVADVIHLLAELVENATVFSAPHTQVLLRAGLVTAGLAVEVEDRGLGLPAGEQTKMNALLADPDQVNVAGLLADGRIGLFVVSQLARRHGITVRLQTNIYGGVQAVLVVPQSLLGAAPGVPGAGARPGGEAQPEAAAPHGAAQPPTLPPGSGSGAGSGSGSGSGTGSDAVGQHGAPAHTAPRRPGETARSAPHVPDGGAPAPLPVRGADQERPTPADALPGIRPDVRHLLTEHMGTPPRPRVGTVRGTMSKPRLPRRRAQEHLAPQLRDGPLPRRDSEHVAGHDPDLMAAFQRGVGLAEAQQHLDAGFLTPAHPSSHPLTPPHPTTLDMEAPDMGSPYTAAPHMAPSDMAPSDMAAPHMAVPDTASAPTDPLGGEPAPLEAPRGTDHLTRHDGRAPAG